MQLVLIVQVILLATIAAGVYMLFIKYERRSGKERRRGNRGGRRAEDALAGATPGSGRSWSREPEADRPVT